MKLLFESLKKRSGLKASPGSVFLYISAAVRKIGSEQRMIKPEFAAFPAEFKSFFIYKTELCFNIKKAAGTVKVDIVAALFHSLLITA